MSVMESGSEAVVKSFDMVCDRLGHLEEQFGTVAGYIETEMRNKAKMRELATRLRELNHEYYLVISHGGTKMTIGINMSKNSGGFIVSWLSSTKTSIIYNGEVFKYSDLLETMGTALVNRNEYLVFENVVGTPRRSRCGRHRTSGLPLPGCAQAARKKAVV